MTQNLDWHRSRSIGALRLALSLVVASLPWWANACCGVSWKPVTFGDQTNLIVWDSSTKTEHFMRGATFFTDAKDLGFIAPTPSVPKLSAASPAAFDVLTKLVNKAMHDAEYDSSDDAAASPKEVNVIQEVDVAGYHAVTLHANDSKALGNWMKRNGYVTSKGIEQWTAKYIAQGWYLTAFKVAKGGDEANMGLVRMSFKADRPFNPYYVPKENIDPGNDAVLKLFFVSDRAYEPHIGNEGEWEPVKLTVSIPEAARSALVTDLKLSDGDIPHGALVEFFEDVQFPRQVADDIYFTEIPTNPLPYVFSAAIVAAALVALGLMLKSLKKSTR